MSPDQLCLDRLEERLNSRVVIAVTLAAHRHLEPVLAQDLLVVVRTILRTAIRVMNAVLGWLSERDCHFQRPDRQVTFHPVAYSPSNDTTGMQVQDHRKIQPSLTGPHIADVTGPFLVGFDSCEVPVQQVRRNIELVIAVPLSADCFAIACRAMVVTLCLRVLTTDMPF